MKFNSLQFGKAMSAALFVLLLSVVGMKNALAQNQVAMLQHNDSLTAFYGPNALSEAHEAAADGDIITLSSGTFNAVGINKAITIRGAGCILDTLTNVLPTIIPGDFALSHSDISFEGIQFTGTVSSDNFANNFGVAHYNDNNSFVKCNVNKIISTNGRAWRRNWQIVNCIIQEFGTTSGEFPSLSIINSVIKITKYDHSDIHNPTNIYNSVIMFNDGLSINNLIAYNSIIATVSEHNVSNCTFFNSIGIETGETLLFEGQTVQNVMEVDGYEDVFETFDGTITYDNIYQLKNDIVTSFLGHDGTEVGIYGGVYPYSTRLHYMIIRNCNVAGRTTVDDKLSVEIELDIDE